MAEAERRSSISLGLPGATLPVADGTVGDEDRSHTIGLYSGTSSLSGGMRVATSYINIPGVGPVPDPLSLEFKTWRDNLINYRLNEIPLERTTTYYVNPDFGNDANPGTEAAPWQTRGKARTEVAASAGDVRVRFAVGYYYRDNSNWLITKPNITIDSYVPTSFPIVSPATPPLFLAFDKVYTSGSGAWTNFSGDVWSAISATTVEWVIQADDRDGLLYGVFSRQNSTANVQANPRSFYYSAGTLYINVGAGLDPNNYTIEGVTRNSNYGICLGAGADGGRIDNIWAYGYGMDGSATGNNIVGIADQLKNLETCLVTNCRSLYATSHAMVHILSGPTNGGGIGTYAFCEAGYNMYNAAAETIFNSYSYEGDQETIFHQCEAIFGTLPSNDWWTNGVGDQKRGIAHYCHTNGSAGQEVGLVIFNQISIANNPFGCRNNGHGGDGPVISAGTLSAGRVFIIEGTMPDDPEYQGVQWGNNTISINCRYNLKIANSTAQCFLASRPLNTYFINCIFDIDGSLQSTSPFGIYNSTSLDNVMCLYNCSMLMSTYNVTFAWDRDTYTGGTNSSPNGLMKSCLFQFSGGSGSHYVGFNNVAANQRYNAYFGASNVVGIRGYDQDPAPVVLATALPVMPTSEQFMYLAFKGDPAIGLEYDFNWRPRPPIPSIGPIELGLSDDSSFRLNQRPWRGRP